MSTGGANEDNFFNFKINHDVSVTGYPTRMWHAIKKYSVNNTLPVVAINSWIQFSLGYAAAVIVTSHDMSFITNILNSRAMPAYALASFTLGAILLTSLIVKYMYKEEVKNEMSKNGKNLIDIKIRGGKSDGISEIAQNALTIEIVPDTSFIFDKKENFSIIVPICGRQGEILKNKRRENRNKIVLFTVPYLLSGLIIIGALIKFGFVNIQSGKEWTFITVIGVMAIVGACITLSKLENNKVDNLSNTIKKFNSKDILLPYRKNSIISVIENKFENKEENDPMSRVLRLFDKYLADLINKVCYLFENDFLKTSNINIQKTFDGVSEDIRTILSGLEINTIKNFDEIKIAVEKGITRCLKDISESIDDLCKNVGNDIINIIGDKKKKISRIINNIEEITTKFNRLDTFGIECISKSTSYAIKKVQTACRHLRLFTENDERINVQVEAERSFSNVRIQTDEQNFHSISVQTEYMQNSKKEQEAICMNYNFLDLKSQNTKLRNALRKQNEALKLEQEIRGLQKENIRLEKELFEQEKINERQKKINDKPSEFLYYLLESIKLDEKATLRNLDNKIIIQWKDGSQTTCYIKRHGAHFSHSTEINFVRQNIRTAFENQRA
ncbi:MAG: hypothetical protein LKM44_00440 [Wolbachia endosymbiont of Meromenopon meropis]|nr:hypothetical protein [Wolbachia endosymbiont of Meromenopon meropis]